MSTGFAGLIAELGINDFGTHLLASSSFAYRSIFNLGKPEVQYRDTITPPVPPEWKGVQKLALEQIGRSHGLRIAVPLLRALLALHGIAGFADGVRLVERLLDERWDSVIWPAAGRGQKILHQDVNVNHIHSLGQPDV